jgi:Putative neutral zinc metallopeptidase
MARARRVLVLLAALPIVAALTSALAVPATRPVVRTATGCVEPEPAVAAIAEQLNQFWRAEGAARLCGTDARRPGSHYHPSERTIYFDPVHLRQALKKFSAMDANHLTWYVLAHEWGHHVQHSWALRNGPAGHAGAASELQADCLAGYFMGRRAFLDRTHRLVFASAGHLDSGWWREPGNQGTADERGWAYLRGLRASGRQHAVAGTLDVTPDAACAAKYFQPGVARTRYGS